MKKKAEAKKVVRGKKRTEPKVEGKSRLKLKKRVFTEEDHYSQAHGKCPWCKRNFQQAVVDIRESEMTKSNQLYTLQGILRSYQDYQANLIEEMRKMRMKLQEAEKAVIR